MERERAISTLSRVGWLAETDAAFRQRLLELADIKERAAGETLYFQGDSPKGLYGLAKGSLSVFSTLGPNEPRLIHIARPGWWVGEASVLGNSMTRIEVTARDPSIILFVAASSVVDLAAKNPETWRYLSLLTISHMDDALRLAGSALAPNARSRLIATLLRLAPARSTAHIQLNISQGELAELAGLSRNSVGPILKELSLAGHITCDRRRIQLHDPDRMSSLIEV